MKKYLSIVIFVLILISSCFYFLQDFNKKSDRRKEFDLFFSQWKVYGIDVSEYNGKLKWTEIETIFNEHEIHFAFIRATAGKNRIDKNFKTNWNSEKHSRIAIGAYHYYRPDENSIEQADNFISQVKLKKGNLPPVLDIERRPKNQSMISLKTGLKKWLDKVEKHYGVKPILYSGSSYFTTFLKKEFGEYPLWIANYNQTKKPVDDDWLIWQYSSRGKVKGAKDRLDINVFNGTQEELKKLLIQ